MFGSFHGNTCTLFSWDGLTFLISKYLFPFTAISRFFTLCTMFVCGVNWFFLFLTLSSFLTVSQRLLWWCKKKISCLLIKKTLSGLLAYSHTVSLLVGPIRKWENFTQTSHKPHINLSQTSHKLHTNFTQHSHKLHMNITQFHANFMQTSCKLHANFMQTSTEF